MSSTALLIVHHWPALLADDPTVRAARLLPSGSQWPGHHRGRTPACRAPPGADRVWRV